MAEPTLIPWDQVAEGPVWFRPKGITDRFVCGLKDDGLLLGPGISGPIDEPEAYEFTAAEQQPGEWVAKLAAAEMRADAAVMALRMAERTQQHNTEQAINAALTRETAALESEQAMNAALTLQLDEAEAALTHLRDGLVALEQKYRNRRDPFMDELLDRIAAMADEIIVRRYDDKFWEVARANDDVILALCGGKPQAEKVAALLRFRDAMTPEMWEAVEAHNHTANCIHNDLPYARMLAALDTLRQELQTP